LKNSVTANKETITLIGNIPEFDRPSLNGEARGDEKPLSFLLGELQDISQSKNFSPRFKLWPPGSILPQGNSVTMNPYFGGKIALTPTASRPVIP